MNLVEHDALCRLRRMGLFLGVLLATLIPATGIAQPIASSSFVGAESPLSENGAWEAITSLAPQGTRFQKNNGAYPDRIVGPDNNHAGARTTGLIPPDHYSEMHRRTSGKQQKQRGADRPRPSVGRVDR